MAFQPRRVRREPSPLPLTGKKLCNHRTRPRVLRLLECRQELMRSYKLLTNF